MGTTTTYKRNESERDAPWLSVALGWALVVLLAALPFEARGGVALPGMLVTNVELLAIVALALWLAVLGSERRLPRAPRWLAVGLGGAVAALLLSALLAPEHRTDAAKFALRQTQGALLALCVAERARMGGARAVRPLLAALLAGASASALLGLWELSESPVALAALAPFKTQLSLMESLMRMSATFAYANIAAMFFEALLPVALCGALGLFGARWRLPCVAASALLAAATILTFSRAALLGLGASLVLVPLAVWARSSHHRGTEAQSANIQQNVRARPRSSASKIQVAWGRFIRHRGTEAQSANIQQNVRARPRSSASKIGPVRQALALSLGVGLVAALTLLASPSLRLRLAAPDPAAWYDARYTSPPVAPMEAGEVRRVNIRIANVGEATWDQGGARPVMLASHWLGADGKLVSFEGLRTPLPRPVAPGESLVLAAQVQAPIEPGRYVLAWDLLRENGGGWFSQGNTPMGRVPVSITPATGAAPTRPAPEQVIVPQPPSPSRRVLWGVALRLWAARPIFGIGPDVFRHVYGRALGLASFDDRIHTNSLYLEVLIGTGLVGALAFAALLGLVLWKGARTLLERNAPQRHRGTEPLQPPANAPLSSLIVHRSSLDNWWCLLAALLALLTFLLHGVLDVFLAFTPTYLLFWLCVGVAAGLVDASGEKKPLREADI